VLNGPGSNAYEALMVLGGLLGFAIGLLFGYAQQSEWPSILWHAASLPTSRAC